MKNEYKDLELEIVSFENMDIITDSNYEEDPNHGNGGNEHGI